MNEHSREEPRVGGAYSHYVLVLLLVVYMFNFIDRNILAILAEDIKADLGVSDAQIGFLYGTVFALFHAIFGIPLGRFADVWSRRNLISIGLFFWSLMTVASGLARSFGVLAVCRIGVGIGEASASPAAYSMLFDYYPPRLRATVVAIYNSGIYIGAGVGVFLGGFILDLWATTYPTDAPFGLKGWQVAFMIVGMPGVLLAGWIATLREPVRGISEGLVAEKHPAPFKVLGRELLSIIPPLNLLGLLGQRRSLVVNMTAAIISIAAAYFLVFLTGSVAQWVAISIGAYATFSWAQSLKLRDPVTFGMMFRSKSFVYLCLAFPMNSFVGFGAGFWIAPLLMRLHDVAPTEVGLYLGLSVAVGGFTGITLGGVCADYLKTKFPSGRLILGYFTILGTIPFLLLVIYSDNLVHAFWFNFVLMVLASSAQGVPHSTISDLVLPRMRAVASAFYILMSTILGLALGPYFIGLMSDMFQAGGMNQAESLRTAIAVSMLALIPALVFMALAQRHLPIDESTRLQRARKLGESVGG